jgi:hypothetical protein
MAGAYQTTGETAKRGTGVWPDTGGGWVNGRGDDSMEMLNGMAHMGESVPCVLRLARETLSGLAQEREAALPQEAPRGRQGRRLPLPTAPTGRCC